MIDLSRGSYHVWIKNKAGSTCKGFDSYSDACDYVYLLMSENSTVSPEDILIEYFCLTTALDVI